MGQADAQESSHRRAQDLLEIPKPLDMVRRRAVALLFAAFFPCASVAAADPDTSKVTCGSTVKLTHANTKAKLHSHEIAYGSGSGQQSVTGFREVNDGNSYWTVKPALGETCVAGEPLASGATIRLQHVNTRKWLHSHLHQSPLSGNQEGSCCGDDEWLRDRMVRLVHVSTGVSLHSHQQKYSRPVTGQFEVCGAHSKYSNNLWIAHEGVYLPVKGSDTEGDAHGEL